MRHADAFATRDLDPEPLDPPIIIAGGMAPDTMLRTEISRGACVFQTSGQHIIDSCAHADRLRRAAGAVRWMAGDA